MDTIEGGDCKALEFDDFGGGRETEFFRLSHDAGLRSKAALARARSKTLRVYEELAKIRQVLECARAAPFSLRTP